ncbi:hypothetical protein [Ferrimicrobium sp.]|uniref:hypothetical protein n=1 Tax=Ferrimicrobium sp. TaxID=2926050 RepID=UPI00262990D1|nr:hypothetical protein [Ferrimicrobium sp.]
MRSRSTRGWLIGGGGLVIVAVLAIIFVLGARGGNEKGTRAIANNGGTSHTLTPRYSAPPGEGHTSAQQLADNAKIAEANQANGAEWIQVEALKLPPPTVSANFPAILNTLRQGSDTYATAFVNELLDINFAKDTRSALLSWAQSELAPDSMPGTPSLASTRVLYGDLVGEPSPIPTASTWSMNAKHRVVWSVSDVSESVNPEWSSALATGWQPSDPLMVALDVTGTLTISQASHQAVSKPFSLELGLASAEYHHGYGAMSVDNWTEG